MAIRTYNPSRRFLHKALIASSFCIGFDLHNTILLSILTLLSRNEFFLQLRPLNDIIFVSTTVFFLMAARLRPGNGKITIPPLAILIFSYTATLIIDSSDLALSGYIRFLAGNVLCFIAASSAIRSQSDLKIFGSLLITTSTILTSITLYLYSTGHVLGEMRDELFPGTEIRTGYYCAFSFIYSLSLSGNRKFLAIKIFTATLALLSSILTSNNAALSLTLIALLAWPLTSLRNAVTSVILIAFSTPFIIFYATTLNTQIDPVFDIINAQQDSVSDRFRIGSQYISLASESIIFGNGISSAYSFELRTHSVTIAFLVQSGIIGAVAYIALIGTSCVPLTRSLVNLQLGQKSSALTISLSLLLFALISQSELSGDIPNNRNCWYLLGTIAGFRYQNKTSETYNGSRQARSKTGLPTN